MTDFKRPMFSANGFNQIQNREFFIKKCKLNPRNFLKIKFYQTFGFKYLLHVFGNLIRVVLKFAKASQIKSFKNQF